ncbi:phenylacetate--CoA ligase family protein [Alkalihalobacillus sp. AL-G]|uniref:phenylacetate--CoA ligase family protein n=1 Tax=Alkalihalobacillus sp. AL-G TaxID=2926399 RepID=UPI00272CDB6B|nr:AMP-binding protein [Alkalihalobacillus sp. AL-G]WLD93263.1 AMP-binding protein [Alkalihalobacillus sp. AL-G]
MGSLQEVIRHAYENANGFREHMKRAGLLPEEISDKEDLHKLPVLKKDDLPDLQKAGAPFGELATIAPSTFARIFMSPGPIYDPQTVESDFWRFSEALRVAGFDEGDIVQNTFSYHLSPAGFMFDSALRDLGATVVPAGTGNTELQVQVMKDLQVTGYVGTPSFFSILLDTAEKSGYTVGKELNLKKAFFTAEMLTTEMRERCEAIGISIFEGYGTADCGCIAYEDKQGPGLKVTSSAIVQICDPLTGEDTSGEGEVVVTLFDKSYPLIRFGTGDLSRWVDGYDGERVAGVLGRVSDGVKVKGMFVREKQLARVLKQEGYSEFQGVVTRENYLDKFEILIESLEELHSELLSRLQDAIRVRPVLTRVKPGTIKNGEKRLIDQRIFDMKKV